MQAARLPLLAIFGAGLMAERTVVDSLKATLNTNDDGQVQSKAASGTRSFLFMKQEGCLCRCCSTCQPCPRAFTA